MDNNQVKPFDMHAPIEDKQTKNGVELRYAVKEAVRNQFQHLPEIFALLEQFRDYPEVCMALQFATYHHGSINQLRKHTGEAYIVHPLHVLKILMGICHTKDQLVAGLLHDVVEDTEATLRDVERVFGKKIADMVEMLTDVSKPEDGVREIRVAIDREHTAQATPEVKTVKLADIVSNTSNMTVLTESFAIKYIAEKRQSLEVLKEGDQTLWQQASANLDVAEQHFFDNKTRLAP